MLQVLSETTDDCVVIHIGGKVMGDEYKLFLDAVDDRLKMHDKINMVAKFDEFTFYGDLESFKEDFHFGTHEYRHLNRCAFVGDAEWVKLFVKFTEHLVRAEEKMFPSGSFDEAVAWATSGE